MNKPTRVDYVRLRPKELLRLEHLPSVIGDLTPRMLKSGGNRPRLTHPIRTEHGEDSRSEKE